MSISVVIADPHPVARAGLKTLLERGDPGAGARFEVLGETGYANDVCDLMEKHHPRLLIAETNLLLRGTRDALIGSFETLQRVRETQTAGLVIHTTCNEHARVAEAQKIGAMLYLLKDRPWKESFDDIVLATVFGRVREDSLIAKPTGSRKPSYDEDIPLTNREVQVLRVLATGNSNREIGRALNISIETVKEHVQNILRKLNAGDRTEAAVWAVKKGIV